MDVRQLRSAIEGDMDRGLTPVAVVATLGTTSSASLDPVREIAEAAQEFGVWLHLDAAYGGPAAIVPELRPLLEGWELGDSIVVNPHKWLFTPIDCSVLFCRRPEELIRAFSIVSEYLTSKEVGTSRNLMDYGVSLGRRFRALKLWFVIRYFGRLGIIERIRAHVTMAQDFKTSIEEVPNWVVVAPVHLSLVTYRFSPGWTGADEDAANHRIMDRVNETGEAFLSHTVLDGRVVLRLSIGNLKTTPERVSRTWTLLREAGEVELAAH
jgi:aromatic-L-amino-acid decarboxylase